MKKILQFLPFLVLLSSCSYKPYYQICKVYSDLPTSDAGGYVYKNSDCDINYNFWSNGGAVSFMISNNSNDILYIDLSKSFLIKNGMAYDYFLNRTTSSTSSMAVSGIMGSTATNFGYWNYFGKKIPGTLSISSAGTIGSQKSSSITCGEMPIIAIPPHAAKVFSEYSIMDSHFVDCDLSEWPSKKEKQYMSFDETTTPIAFRNYLCYRIGESNDDHFIENNFYINEVINQHYDATFRKAEVGCTSDKYKNKELVFIRTSPKEFYIRYTPTSEKKSKIKLGTYEDGIY